MDWSAYHYLSEQYHRLPILEKSDQLQSVNLSERCFGNFIVPEHTSKHCSDTYSRCSSHWLSAYFHQINSLVSVFSRGQNKEPLVGIARNKPGRNNDPRWITKTSDQ